MTSKGKGPPRKGALAALTVYPPEPARHETPTEFDETIESHEDFAEGMRVHHVQRYVAGILVAFSVTLDRLVAAGWEQIARLDSWDGEVPKHQLHGRAGDEQLHLT